MGGCPSIRISVEVCSCQAARNGIDSAGVKVEWR